MEDLQIIQLYWQRDPAAIQESSEKYGSYCFAIAERILGDAEDAKECVNDTWLRAWQAIPPQKPRVLRLFLARITRNLAFDRYSARQTEKRGGRELALVLDELADCVGSGRDTAAAYEAKELGQAVQRFLETLPERERALMLRRYFFAEPVADIAKRYGLRAGNVSAILSRGRKKLRAHLEKEGYL